MHRGAVSTLVFALLLTLPRARDADEKSDPGRLTVRSAPFATGELDRVQRHLFSASGLVRADYRGPNKSLCVEGKAWKDGKLTAGPAVVPIIRDGDTADVSVTVQDDWISRHESMPIVKI